MECLTGETLAARIAVEPLRPAQVRAIGAQLLRALDAAHRHGIIHRDIKPANLLFTSTGTVKVADFGIATTTDSPRVTATGLVLGTLAYLAPERLQGAPATPQSDIYAAGVVLYEALTGRKPFEADSPAELLDQISSGSSGQIAVAADVGSKLMHIVTRALREDLRARYATAGAMARALERAPIAEPRSSLPPPPLDTIVMPAAVAGHRPRRRSVVLTAMAFLATAGGVGTFVAQSVGHDPTAPMSPASSAPAVSAVNVVPLVSTTVVTTTAQPTTTVATTTVSSTSRVTSTTVRSTTTRPATTTATTRNSRGKGKGRDD
jgi:serine/threonine protein kinase